jgi:hypothetical protein
MYNSPLIPVSPRPSPVIQLARSSMRNRRPLYDCEGTMMNRRHAFDAVERQEATHTKARHIQGLGALCFARTNVDRRFPPAGGAASESVRAGLRSTLSACTNHASIRRSEMLRDLMTELPSNARRNRYLVAFRSFLAALRFLGVSACSGSSHLNSRERSS